MFNITKHRLVPKHIILEEQKKKEIIKLYGNKLPLIRNDDVVVKFIGAKIGDIIKIIRKNPHSLYYRIVIKSVKR